MKSLRVALAGAALLLAGCSAHRDPLVLADVDRVRVSPAAVEASKADPTAYAHAEALRRRAAEEETNGNVVAAQLLADRAAVAYSRAVLAVRRLRAQQQLDHAAGKQLRAQHELETFTASRAKLDAEAGDLELRLSVAREVLLPARSGPADPAREAARLTAARSLAAQARLLCSAAHLAPSDAAAVAALAATERELVTLEERLATGPRPAPIDAAARQRAACLDRLTRARRAGNAAPDASDALLAELSARGGYDPSPDERGVVVVLRDIFAGTTLTPRAVERLTELGRVAAANPRMGVLAVLHDATPPTDVESKRDRERLDAAVRALEKGGVAPSKLRGELARALAPLIDPSDVKARGRNERLEVVFVMP